MADPNNKPIIPSITGFPALDSILAAAILGGAGLIDGKIYGLMDAHALHSADYQAAIFSCTVATLAAIATLAWRIFQTRLNQLAVTQHVITAAATGEIPDAIKMAAFKAPSISEVDITKALNNAETIQAQQ